MKTTFLDVSDPSPVLLFEWFGITRSNCCRAIVTSGVKATWPTGQKIWWRDFWLEPDIGGYDLTSPLDFLIDQRKIYCLRLHRFVPAKRKIEKLRMDVVQATENIVHIAMPFTTFLAKLLAAKVLRNAGENEAADKVWS